MAYRKGRKIETGIWELVDQKGMYLAEVNWKDTHTRQRVRERRTANKVEPLRNWRNTRKTDALRGEVRRDRGRKKQMPLCQFMDEYLESWSRVEKRPSTYQRDQYSAKYIIAFFGKRTLGSITRRDIEKYVAQRKAKGAKPGTVNREMCCLKNMLRKAVDWEYLDSNPAGGVSQQREELKEFEFLTVWEVDRLIDVAPSHLKVLFTMAAHTGLRRGELFKLEWRDVNFNRGGNGTICVRDSKNYETRYVPMNSAVRLALEKHPRRIVDGEMVPYVFSTKMGCPLKDIRTGLGYALRRAKITRHIRFHDLRHTFASLLTMKGVDLRTVAKLMGHMDIRITMRYAHLAPEHLQAAVEVLGTRPEGNAAKAAG